MARRKREKGTPDPTEWREAGRSDSGLGSDGAGAVDGLGGASGSSGTGGVRGSARAVGDLSGLDQRHGVETPPMPGVLGKGGARGGRKMTQSDGGLPGMTRGPDNESFPNQEDKGSPDDR